MHILFDHSNPFLLAHGGLQIQIEQTRSALVAAGASVEHLRWWDAGQSGDLIHFFGRPHPSYIAQAGARGIPVVFSELLTGTGSRSAAARFAQRLAIGATRALLPRGFTVRMGWDSYALAAAVIALTTWERDLMRSLFRAEPSRLHVIPNGVESFFFEKPGPAPAGTPHLICTATITWRKRVLELAQAALLSRVPVRFFGRPYSPDDPYFLRFKGLVDGSGGLLEYGGEIPDRPRLARAYREAAGFVLLSSMESQSLSALEAAACGCPLLLADLPWARASFGDQASYAPLASPERTAPHLRRFLDSPPQAFPSVLSWDEVAARLTAVYEAVLGGPRRTGS